MTTYNTGNPLGSASPKDLFDNAENLDQAVNNLVSRTWVDRRGTMRRTFKGMEMDFNDFISASGFVNLGVYASGLVISSYNQTFTRSGFAYRASPSTVLPYTTTGNWATEEIKFVIAGDSTLRQDLALPTGANLVGFKYSGTGSTLRTLEQVVRSTGTLDVRGFGALGDGIADDTAAITAAAAAAYASGAMLLLPSGGIFNTTGQLDIKVALQGYGATLVNITASEKADKFANATIILNAVGASVSGLRIVCNHKTSGISAKSIAAAIVRDVQIIDPIMAGVCFEDVASATITNSFMQDVRCNSVELDSADGVYSLNCTSFSAEGIRVVGFQRSAVFAKQNTSGAKTCNIYKVEASGGNYPYPSGILTALVGVGVDSVSSASIDGVIVSNMPDSTHPSMTLIAGLGLMNSATLYIPVYTITRVQLKGKNLTGNLARGILVAGSQPTAAVSFDSIDLQSVQFGFVVYGGVDNITTSNVIGRKMIYDAPANSLFYFPYAGLVSADFSNIQDLAAVRTGAGDSATTFNLACTGATVFIRDCPSPISLSASTALKELSITNCTEVKHRSVSTPMSAALVLKITGSYIKADGASSKTLYSSGGIFSINGSTIDDFSATSNQPSNITVTNSRFNNSPVPIASDISNISGCTMYPGAADSAIFLGVSHAYTNNIVSVTGCFIQMSGGGYPIATLRAETPKNYIISGVQWGSLSALSNFNGAKGLSVNNRRLSFI